MRSNRPTSLSMQIVASLIVLTVASGLGLIVVGHNAVSLVDATSAEQQARFATRNFASIIAEQPEDQRSVTIWNDAVIRTAARDFDWMDENLGIWVHDYFGHDETYVLDRDNLPYYAAVSSERSSTDRYSERAALIAPMVTQLRETMATASAGLDNPYEELADVSVAAPVKFNDVTAIVSLVPIISESGRVSQTPGAESLHVALQYIDAELAQKIGAPIELQDVAFGPLAPAEGQAGIPATDLSGDAVAWLTWQPERPGTTLLMEMLPVLLASIALGALMLCWVINRLVRLSSQLQVSEAQARFLANHDVLTGLPNRILFQERLTQAMHSAVRDDNLVALVAIDLDNFKRINDSLGHPAGDELVRQVGNRLVDLVRASDTVARFGGDEFLILLRDVSDEDQLRRFCERIVVDLSHPYALLGDTANVGASVGAVLARADDQDWDELMRRADIALYRAKSDGKGRYSLFEADIGKIENERNQLESDLRKSLTSGTDLHLVYQPFFDENGKMKGAEALCRWNHPQRGALSPEIFIGLAEQRGLIDQLGRWVLETACEFAAGTSLAKIAVNVSPIQLRHSDFVPMVLSTLRETGLAPERLEIELTEQVLLDQPADIREKIGRLRAAGISIALDDFATGNSSLQYLRDYRVDSIKIDRSFVARLGKDDECDHLVQAMLDLVRAMAINVTVEGVETQIQHDRLASMGCKTFQGYLLGYPMEPGVLASLIANEADAAEGSEAFA
ncbi:MAG: EAL domain-containing protein [Loktanella sp.]|nr:EAL domain-containing protein [Loktanella sp.]